MSSNVAIESVICPRCGFEANYRYGKAPNGDQKYLCLSCGKQFTEGSLGREPVIRPNCPTCNAPMYVYGRSEGFMRFRCSRYPACKTYLKVSKSQVQEL